MKTKFTVLFTVITMIAILLAACSGADAATASGSSGLSTATKLVVGTLNLEGTGNAVTTAQATQLLTLWEGYQSLNKSDTSSQLELDALVKQIQGIMTANQLQAIEAMNLTEQSVSEETQSISGSAIANAPVSTPGSTTLNQAAPGGGPGGMPGGGGGDSVMSAINGGTTLQGTPASTQAAGNTGATQVNSMVLNALIQMLLTRSQTTG
jgi:hypothetical protein